MVYGRYGKIFQKYREERNLSRTDFLECQITKSALEKFENGEKSLSIEKIDAALQYMNIPLHEYSYRLNKGTNDYFIELFEEIDNAFYCEDKVRLQEIYKSGIECPDLRLIALSAKACYSSLDPEEQKEIADYLFMIEFWGAKELWIFTDTIDQLASSTIGLLLDEFLIKSSYYRNITDYNRLIVQAANNAVLVMIARGNKNSARTILDFVSANLWEVDEFARTVNLFMSGYWDYQFKDKIIGKNEMEQALSIFKVLKCEHLHNIYRKQYDKIIK